MWRVLAHMISGAARYMITRMALGFAIAMFFVYWVYDR